MEELEHEGRRLETKRVKNQTINIWKLQPNTQST